ncbi:CDP-alcohol phosphatidyltransferase [Streptomyces sp. DSM 15324]|uniref:CDP-alcohol phosphatidyltransferase n=1 Tax=Streptomyces sp. DSM 15324 TaxID=1739111 RepID=UPI000747597B|nr:CDP-alcohol phosphatidyltransferase [Streptomyces sp. DSM 15324]KUO14037.1 CDP-alcohol phosphatidyltransferase [Streptomyces sp. DSM 15324]
MPPSAPEQEPADSPSEQPVTEPVTESVSEPVTDSEGASAAHPSLKARIAYLRGWRGRHPGAARGVWWAVTLLSLVWVIGALLLPNRMAALQVNRFIRLPGEAIIGAAVLLALPRRPRIALAALGGAVLGALTVLNLLDIGFVDYLGRDFNLVLDWGLLDDAQSYLADTLGRTAALAAAVGVVLLVVLVITVTALATVRLSNILVRDPRRATRGTLIAGTAWITCSVLGLQYAGIPVASDRVANQLQSEARKVRDTIRDEAAFGKETRSDTFGNTPADQLVPDLRGKDMIFTFIESYGRSAIEDPIMAPGVDATLQARTEALAKAGFRAKSGWLTSATYGGSSWLGHSTTLSGLWVDNQQRYRTVMASDHLSLTKAFRKTGAWDTVGIMPGVQKGWPEAKFYGLDKVYNAFQMGYRGPKFSWSTMPDQYALEAFQQLEHSKRRDKPLMSEIILTSSHQPWAPIPKMVGWDELGDGSVFDAIEAAGNKASDVIADPTKSKEEYGKSIQYSVTALTEWLERYGSDDTVLVFLGDHQPISRVSGENASRDVPISIVAKDPKVLDKIASWKWTDGLRPAHNAPVWKMSSFRDRFLTAYGSTMHPKKD